MVWNLGSNICISNFEPRIEITNPLAISLRLSFENLPIQAITAVSIILMNIGLPKPLTEKPLAQVVISSMLNWSNLLQNNVSSWINSLAKSVEISEQACSTLSRSKVLTLSSSRSINLSSAMLLRKEVVPACTQQYEYSSVINSCVDTLSNTVELYWNSIKSQKSLEPSDWAEKWLKIAIKLCGENMVSFLITYVSRLTHRVGSEIQYQSMNLAVLTYDFSLLKVIMFMPSSRTNDVKVAFYRSSSLN